VTRRGGLGRQQWPCCTPLGLCTVRGRGRGGWGDNRTHPPPPLAERAFAFTLRYHIKSFLHARFWHVRVTRSGARSAPDAIPYPVEEPRPSAQYRVDFCGQLQRSICHSGFNLIAGAEYLRAFKGFAGVETCLTGPSLDLVG
jgi:hypothetical protein